MHSSTGFFVLSWEQNRNITEFNISSEMLYIEMQSIYKIREKTTMAEKKTFFRVVICFCRETKYMYLLRQIFKKTHIDQCDNPI